MPLYIHMLSYAKSRDDEANRYIFAYHSKKFIKIKLN